MLNQKELFFENETRKHQQQVTKIMLSFVQKLMDRAISHDNSKFESPEREVFVEHTPALNKVTYGSEEYKKHTSQMKEAIQVHYSRNKHHPQFNDINGYSYQCLNDSIRAMNMLDIIEMLCDWLAASKRHADGDISKSLEINEKRFHINEQLTAVFRNTIALMEDKNESI